MIIQSTLSKSDLTASISGLEVRGSHTPVCQLLPLVMERFTVVVTDLCAWQNGDPRARSPGDKRKLLMPGASAGHAQTLLDQGCPGEWCKLGSRTSICSEKSFFRSS